MVLFDLGIKYNANKSLNQSQFLASTGTDISGSLASQSVPLMGIKTKKTAAEGTLPWRRQPHGTTFCSTASVDYSTFNRDSTFIW